MDAGGEGIVGDDELRHVGERAAPENSAAARADVLDDAPVGVERADRGMIVVGDEHLALHRVEELGARAALPPM